MDKHSKQLILGLDIGTSSVRAALYDHAGSLLPRTLVSNNRALTTTSDGGAEISAKDAFAQVVTAVDSVLENAAKVKGDIRHVAMSCFWHSLVGIDANEKPTTNVLGWADNRSRDQVAVLRGKLDGSAIHNRTGARFHPSYWPAKLLWLRKSAPDAFARTEKWLSLSDLIMLRLARDATTSVSMASGTGIFDIRRLEWDAELMRYLRLGPNSLPQVADDDAEGGKLKTQFAKRWPRLANAQWLRAIGDGAANNIGAGCMEKNKAALMIGTSGAIRVAYKGEPPKSIPPGLWCYRIDRSRVIIGGALSDGGGLYEWLRRFLRIEMSDSYIHKEIARRGADGHGLTFIPFLAGERSTGYNEYATGSIHGLTMAHDAVDILQAGMESVAFRLAAILEQLEKVCSISTIVATGGALNASPVWTQIIADVLGRDLEVSDQDEASLRGAVLLAHESTGKIDLSDSAVPDKNKLIEYHPACHKVYNKARERHEELVKYTVR